MMRLLLLVTILFTSACRLNNLINGENGKEMGPEPVESPVLESTQVIIDSDSIQRNLGGADELEFDWQTEGPEAQIEVQVSLDGIDWQTISLVSTELGSLNLSIRELTLDDNLYKLRIVVGSQAVDLGDILIDKTPPVLFNVSQNVSFGCGTNGLFQPATDNMGGTIIYEVVGVLPATVTDCLDGTSSNVCSLAPVAPFWAEVDYVAIDEMGNTSEVGTLMLGYCS